jgi:hypothetical protein
VGDDGKSAPAPKFVEEGGHYGFEEAIKVGLSSDTAQIPHSRWPTAPWVETSPSSSGVVETYRGLNQTRDLYLASRDAWMTFVRQSFEPAPPQPETG